MGLLNDLQEIKDKWKELPPRQKIIVVIPGFLAISPIASLSKSIIQWRGFFRDGLVFYQENILVYLIDVAESTGLIYSSSEADTIILLTLVFTGFLRSIILSQEFFRLSTLVLSCLYIILVWLLGQPSDLSELFTFTLLFIYIATPAFILALLYLVNQLEKEDEKQADFIKKEIEITHSKLQLVYGPTFVAVIFVLLAAAINMALVTPLT